MVESQLRTVVSSEVDHRPPSSSNCVSPGRWNLGSDYKGNKSHRHDPHPRVSIWIAKARQLFEVACEFPQPRLFCCLPFGRSIERLVGSYETAW